MKALTESLLPPVIIPGEIMEETPSTDATMAADSPAALPGGNPPPDTPRAPTAAYRIIPGWLTSAGAFASAVTWAVRHYGRLAAYHGLRTPWYGLKLAWQTPLGLLRVIIAVTLWVLDADSLGRHRDATLAASKDSPATYLRIRQDRHERIMSRALAAGIVAIVAIATVVILSRLAGSWPLALAAVITLGVVGRRKGEPFAPAPSASTHTPRLTPALITASLGALGNAEINKALRNGDGGIGYPSPVMRDGRGWRSDIDLPAGVTAGDVIERRDRLASGLRRPLSCVWPEADRDQHAGRLVLWVADKPMSGIRLVDVQAAQVAAAAIPGSTPATAA